MNHHLALYCTRSKSIIPSYLILFASQILLLPNSRGKFRMRRKPPMIITTNASRSNLGGTEGRSVCERTKLLAMLPKKRMGVKNAKRVFDDFHYERFKKQLISVCDHSNPVRCFQRKG